jgi:hypothetical protein
MHDLGEELTYSTKHYLAFRPLGGTLTHMLVCFWIIDFLRPLLPHVERFRTRSITVESGCCTHHMVFHGTNW